MKAKSMVLVLAIAVVSETWAQTTTPSIIPGIPASGSASAAAGEMRIFELALAFAKKELPEIEYNILDFRILDRQSGTDAVSVRVVGVPASGSKLRSATHGYDVLVHPDGKVTRPPWSLRIAW